MMEARAINEDGVKRYIKNLVGLSTIPSLMGKVLGVINDPNSPTREILDVIAHDLSLAERVVRVANSSLFGHSGEVKDIGQAVMLLGYDRIKSIALGMSVMTLFPSKKSFDPANLWKHGYEVAVLAEAFSQIICMTCPQECFLLGLLHDIGRVILSALYAGRLPDIKGDNILEEEKKYFGCTHAEVGAWFAAEHGMPPEMISVNQYHHSPSHTKEYRDSAAIVSLAEAMSEKLSPCPENDGRWTEEHDILLMEYDLKDEDLQFVGGKFCAAKPEIENFFAAPVRRY